jgi:ketosteroid isomerase-like protein
MARFALAGLAAAALSAGTGVAADQQSQIQAAYDHQCDAAIAKDASGFASTFSPDFVAIDLDRNQRTLTETVAAVETPPQSMIFEACKFVIRGIQIDGSIATVLVTQTVSGTLVSDAAVKPFVRVEDSTDVWKFSARPLEVASKGTGERLIVDGNVVQDRGILASPGP